MVKERAQYINSVNTCSLCSIVPLQYVLLMLTGLKRKCLKPIQYSSISTLHMRVENTCVCAHLWRGIFIITASDFNFARFGKVHSRATVYDYTLVFTLHE